MLKIFFRELEMLRIYYFFAPLTLYVLLPMLNVAAVRQESDDLIAAIPAILSDAQRISILAAAWWTALILRPFLHGHGNEVLHIYLSGLRNLFIRMIMLLFWILLHLALVLLIYARLFSLPLGMILTVGLQVLLIVSTVYALSVLLRNTFVPLLLCVMAVTASYIDNIKTKIPFIIFDGEFQPKTLSKYYIMLSLLVLVFLVIGYCGEKKLYGNQTQYKI